MATNKIDKALYGPSLTEIILGAVLGLLAGVMVACVYLVFKPVMTVKVLPPAPARSMVYYLPGTDSRAKGKEWQAKAKQFISGGVCVVLNEDELNTWAASLVSPASAMADSAAPAKPATPAAKPAEKKAEKAAKPILEGFVIPAKPNFRVYQGKLQIGTLCTLNWYGLSTDVTVQATGMFEQVGETVVFVPDSVYLGSCPLHFLPPLANMLITHVAESERVSEDLRAAWAKLTDAKIEGSTLKLTVQ